MIAFQIIGPNCGRGRDGQFVCVCGKCKALTKMDRFDIQGPIETMVTAFRSAIRGTGGEKL